MEMALNFEGTIYKIERNDQEICLKTIIAALYIYGMYSETIVSAIAQLDSKMENEMDIRWYKLNSYDLTKRFLQNVKRENSIKVISIFWLI